MVVVPRTYPTFQRCCLHHRLFGGAAPGAAPTEDAPVGKDNGVQMVWELVGEESE